MNDSSPFSTTSRHCVKIDAKFTHKTRNFDNGFDFWVAARVHTPNMQIIMVFARISYLLFCVTLVASQTEYEGQRVREKESGFAKSVKTKFWTILTRTRMIWSLSSVRNGVWANMTKRQDRRWQRLWLDVNLRKSKTTAKERKNSCKILWTASLDASDANEITLFVHSTKKWKSSAAAASTHTVDSRETKRLSHCNHSIRFVSEISLSSTSTDFWILVLPAYELAPNKKALNLSNTRLVNMWQPFACGQRRAYEHDRSI